MSSAARLSSQQEQAPVPLLPCLILAARRRNEHTFPAPSTRARPTPPAPLPFRFPSRSKKQQQAHLSGPIDVIVATPTRFLQHVKEGNVFYKDISWLVVDEADTILADKGWAEELKTILGPLRARPDRPKAAVVLVSATMSKVGEKVEV